MKYPKIICEIASSHEGSVDDCINLIHKISELEVDYVKFQIFDTKELISNSIVNSPLNKIYIKPESWDLIIKEAFNCKLKIICEFYDLKSVNLISNHRMIDAYKIPTSDINDFLLLDKIYAYNKTVFIGVGGALTEEINILIDYVKKYKNETVLLHGFQNFPTKIDDVNIVKIKWLSSTYNLDIGYADHTDSDNELRDVPSFIALALGATYIEKHISPNRFLKKSDYNSALNPDEFKLFVSNIKKVTKMMKNSSFLALDQAEEKYRENMKKYAIAKEDIFSGQPFDINKIVFKRTLEPGIPRIFFLKRNYRAFLKNINSGCMLRDEDLG